MSSTFEQVLLAEIASVRHRLAQDESLARFELCVHASGRMDGDVSVTFSVGEYSTSVSGDSFDSVVSELLRQRGWQKRHAPLCLPNAAPVADEVPF